MADHNQSDFPAPTSAVEQPAADVHFPAVGGGNQTTYSYPIRHPEKEVQDFQVVIRATVLRRCRSRLESIAQHRYPKSDVLLAVFTLGVGGALSAALAGVKLPSWQGMVFFIGLPLVSVGCIVAYGMLRHFAPKSVQQLAADILEDLSNPDDSVDVTKR